MESNTDKSELKQEGYPDEIAAEVYRAKRRATTMFHDDHDDGDTAIYQLLAELAPLVTQQCNQARIEGELKGIALAFDSHDYDGIRKRRSELQAQAKEMEGEK